MNPPLSGSNHLAKLPTSKCALLDDWRPMISIRSAQQGRGGIDLNNSLALAGGGVVTVTKSQCFSNGNEEVVWNRPVFATSPPDFCEVLDLAPGTPCGRENTQHMRNRCNVHRLDRVYLEDEMEEAEPCSECFCLLIVSGLQRLKESGWQPKLDSKKRVGATVSQFAAKRPSMEAAQQQVSSVSNWLKRQKVAESPSQLPASQVEDEVE